MTFEDAYVATAASQQSRKPRSAISTKEDDQNIRQLVRRRMSRGPPSSRRFIQFAREVIEEVLSLVRRTLRGGCRAQVHPVGLAQDLSQRPLPDDGGEGPRRAARAVDLAAEGQLVGRGAPPSESGSGAAQIQRVGRLRGPLTAKKSDFERPRAAAPTLPRRPPP